MSKKSWGFAVGDYAAGALTAVATASAVHGLVTPAWDMALAMLIGAAVGTVVHLAVAALAGPLVGMFPAMASGSLIGSYGGMIFGMRDSMQVGSWAGVLAVAVAFGLAVVGVVRLYDRALRGRGFVEPGSPT